MYFLVDLENVHSEGLRGAEFLKKSDSLTLFFSEAAHVCESRYLKEIVDSGCSFDTCKLARTGKNGLDFYIATRVGEFYGAGIKTTQVAIISKDQGYRAVRDYWNARVPSLKRVILAPSIEKSFISSNINSNRVKAIRKLTSNVDLDLFQARYEERMRIRKELENVFSESPFIDRVGEIQELLGKMDDKREIYRDSLHRFGKQNGLLIYNRLRPILYQQM